MKLSSILYICNSSNMGGAEKSLIDMLKGMIKKQICPVVIIPGKGIIEEKLQELNIKYYIVNFSNGYGKIGTSTETGEDDNFFDNYLAARKLQEIIKQEKIQLIHINSSVSNVGAFAALMSDIPYVWHFRELLEEDFDSEFWDKKLKIKLINCANQIITISDCVQEAYKRKYDVDSVRIYNGIDIEKYLDEDIEGHLQCVENNFVITGAITENKGQWDAIKAIKLLVEEGIENVHLTLIGKGGAQFLWVLKKYVENNHLNKYVDICEFSMDLSELRRGSQFSLTTSKMEALGRCTIEPMLAGNLVIGANTGGTLELIGAEQEKGLLYKQGDYKSLALMMKKALELDKETQYRMRKLAQEYALSVFDLDKYCENVINVYQAVLEQKKEQRERFELLQELDTGYEFLKGKEINEKNILKSDSKSLYAVITDKWEKIHELGYSVKDYLMNKNIKKVAIYGMGALGCRLYDEIYSNEISVVYVVDKNARNISQVVMVKEPEVDMGDIDILIIAVANEERELVDYYKEKLSVEVVGISEILENLINRN